jgi:hypothetical protein
VIWIVQANRLCSGESGLVLASERANVSAGGEDARVS